MRLNIAHKIFSVALIALVAMTSVATYSIHLTSEISSELTFIAEKQLPLNDIIAEINVRILEKDLLLERVFLEPDKVTASAEKLAALSKIIRKDFAKADALIDSEIGDKNAPALSRTLSSRDTWFCLPNRGHHGLDAACWRACSALGPRWPRQTNRRP